MNYKLQNSIFNLWALEVLLQIVELVYRRIVLQFFHFIRLARQIMINILQFCLVLFIELRLCWRYLISVTNFIKESI